MRYPTSILIIVSAVTALSACSSSPPVTIADDDDFESEVIFSRYDPIDRGSGPGPGPASDDRGSLTGESSDHRSPQSAAGHDIAQVQWDDESQPYRRTPVLPWPRAAAPIAAPPTLAAQPPSPAIAVTPPSQNVNDQQDHRAAIAGPLGAAGAATDSPMLQAFTLAAISAAGKGEAFDADTITGLTPLQRRRVGKLYQLLLAMRQDVAAGKTSFDRATLTSHLDRVFEADPISIRTLRRVERVFSFGVYDLFNDNDRIIAGRANAMILYVELDNFKIKSLPEGRHQVRLAQEVELHTAHDGESVWYQPRQEVVDTSRNRRRDFFVRQMITLPANLPAGKYILKVRIHDLIGNTVAEDSLNLSVVADTRIVSRAVK